jgi:hypothetical protein
MAKQNIIKIEVKKGKLLAVATQDMNNQPKTHVVYWLTLYKEGKKIHNEEMKVYGAGVFQIDKVEVEVAAEFVENAVVFA